MKLIIDNDNNIICKSNRSNEYIASEIKKSIWNANIIKRSAERPKHWIRNNIILNQIEEIDINNSFSVDLWENNITIFGDDGLIELEIVDINNIENL